MSVRRVALVAAMATMLVGIGADTPARASDFWDEVRTPGLKDYRRHVREGRQAAEAGQWQEALEHAEQAIDRIEDRAPAWVLKGRALGELGRLSSAAEAFRRALAIDERALDDAESGTHAAQIAAVAGEHELAALILPRVLGRMESSSARGDLYGLYGDVLLTLGRERLREAIVAYREAVRHGARGSVQARIGLALALRREGEELEAGDLAAEVAARGRIDAMVATIPVPEGERAARRAVALDAVGDTEGARLAWEAALTWAPWREHALRELGRAPDPEEAEWRGR